ncbi:MAG: prolyl aminopeptidase [Gammaproteobacteria bacterium]|jgi:proline iminopeptidase|nr:prolyl aminopeptidase [Gammaproteobacteria bacterium]
MNYYFPPILPYNTFSLSVDATHELYVEELGNPDGVPVLFLHGGPGNGCGENSRRLFNPEKYRIILFDQRGAGRSTPYAETLHNNTQNLVADIETLRKKLGIDRWVIFGSSWGSLLGLVYAQTHPDPVMAMILRSTFLNRNEDLKWLYGERGIKHIYPDYWQDFLAPIPEGHRHNPIIYYHVLLNSDNELERMRAAEAWTLWEARCLTLVPDPAFTTQREEPHMTLALARLSCHYLINNCFLEPGQVMRDLDRIIHIPAIFIHGRYDMLCPFDGAWHLHKAWPNSQLYIAPAAGHHHSDPAMLEMTIQATEIAANWFLKK